MSSPEGAQRVSTTSSWLHGYLVFLAFATFFLLVAGALVTSNDAGLSVPDWPTSFGTFRMPRMVGGVLYEHGHRMFAATIGLLTVIMAVWVWLKEPRKWLKYLAGAAVLAVVAQGILGGITVLFYLPFLVSTGHAALGQSFFCILVTMAVTTQKDWSWDEVKIDDSPSFLPIRKFAIIVPIAVFVQLILGALYRHNGIGIMPHATWAIVVIVLALWMAVRILSHFMAEGRLVGPVKWLIGLVAIQLFLGIVALILRIQFRDAPQPMPPLIKVSTAHVAVGALVLAQSVVLALQIFRRVNPAGLSTNMVGVQQGASS